MSEVCGTNETRLDRHERVPRRLGVVLRDVSQHREHVGWRSPDLGNRAASCDYEGRSVFAQSNPSHAHRVEFDVSPSVRFWVASTRTISAARPEIDKGVRSRGPDVACAEDRDRRGLPASHGSAGYRRPSSARPTKGGSDFRVAVVRDSCWLASRCRTGRVVSGPPAPDHRGQS